MASEDDRLEIELNPKERLFYDRLRSWVCRSTEYNRFGFRDIFFLLPDAGVLLLRLLKDKRVSGADKTIALLGLAYWLSPIDLVPTLLFGPIGLLDDLLVLCAAVSRIVNHVHPDIVRVHWPGPGDALAVICRISSWSERKIRRRLSRFLGRR